MISTTAITYTTDSPEIKALCDSDARLALIIHRYGDLTYSLHTDTFTFFAETIIGQMLSSKAANAIASRLYELCGGNLNAYAVLKLEMPSLREIGLSGHKAEYILKMAALMAENPDYFDNLKSATDSEIIRRLTALRGIGSWSAKMYLIFVLNRLDVLPYEDGAFLQVYKWLYATEDIKPASIKQRCAPWTPFASLAARYLYRALDEGLMQDVMLNVKLKNQEYFLG